MKKNLYYASVLRRRNIFKEFFLNLAYPLASFARMPLEVFTRRNFGERYFSFPQLVVLLIIMAVFPLINFKGQGNIFNGDGIADFTLKYLTWYVFIAAAFKVSLQRKKEVERLPSVFDFGRFSLSTGVLDPRFREIKINGKHVDIRAIETLVEPTFFLIIGTVLSIFGQAIGYFIVVCSMFYSLSYVMAYHIGDHFIMDLIDNMISAEELAAAFTEDRPASETRGFQTYGRKPQDPEMRRKVADAMVQNEEPVFAV